MTIQNLLKSVMMMPVMARMLGLFVGSLQTVTTSYRYRPFILKEENLSSPSPHGDKNSYIEIAVSVNDAQLYCSVCM